MNKPSEVFSAHLKEYRARHGLTQSEMADMLKMPRATYNYYENNKSVPDVNSLVSISVCLGLSTDYLLGLNPSDNQTMETKANADIANALIKGFNTLVNQLYGAPKQ